MSNENKHKALVCGPFAYEHVFGLILKTLAAYFNICGKCGAPNTSHPLTVLDELALVQFCSNCGHDMRGDQQERRRETVGYLVPEALQVYDDLTDGDPEKAKEILDQKIEDAFPAYGIYIYHHPHEGYKIGKAENVTRRMAKHLCSAPSSVLLHVIETSDLDWCERFLHDRFRHRRIYSNHEYFNLTLEDILWLFSIRVLEPPRSEATQHSLLDLL